MVQCNKHAPPTIETGALPEAANANHQLPTPALNDLDFSNFGKDSIVRDFYWYTQRLFPERQRIV
ncbi:hypothetical protein BN77_3321 [Rhizobium mesoamericanum STM3625]|uniref:Uncharacterized protein n=1 Tax=Rhizobium mesoamericanum STM3625 TaxID=1211777 RepID=K0PQQ1_9HYPH|nr:hypothetical protein BN77_3321 [Rhizobium mesoamericanum STM3625]